MELAPSIIKQAVVTLQESHDIEAPQQIGRGPFYLARAEDQSVLAHGVVLYNGVEYKVGTLSEGMHD